MLLGLLLLDNVANVNQFSYVERIEATEGDQFDVYVQLYDLGKKLRYVPASGATLEVTLDNIDDAIKLVRVATQPYSTTDPSIWKITVTSSDKIRGTCSVKLKLTESTRVTRGIKNPAVLIHSSSGL